MNIKKCSHNYVELYIERAAMQHIMKNQLPEIKVQSESHMTVASRGDTKSLYEISQGEDERGDFEEEQERKGEREEKLDRDKGLKQDSPPGGLSFDEPEEPKGPGSPRSRSPGKR